MIIRSIHNVFFQLELLVVMYIKLYQVVRILIFPFLISKPDYIPVLIKC